MVDTFDIFSSLDKKLEQILLSQANFSNTLHDIVAHTSILESKLETKLSVPPPTPTYTSTPPPLSSTSLLSMVMMHWVGFLKITQFFDFHSTPPEQRTQIPSFYLEGPALAWYQWMHNNGLLTSWMPSSMTWNCVLHYQSLTIRLLHFDASLKLRPYMTIFPSSSRSPTSS